MSDNTEIDLNDEKIQAALKEAVAKEVDGLKRKNEELILTNKKLKETSTTTNDVDVEEYEQLKRERAEREEAEAKKRGEFDKLLTSANERREKEVSQAREDAERIRKRLERKTVMNEILASIAEEKANAELLTPKMLERVRYVEIDGIDAIEVLNERGEPMLGEKGEAATLKDLHEEFKRRESYQVCYPATSIPGTGSRPNTGRGVSRNPFAKETFNLTEQMKLSRENPALAAQMEAAAKAA